MKTKLCSSLLIGNDGYIWAVVGINIFMIKRIFYNSNTNGQALIENVLLIPVIVTIIFAIVWFSRVLLTKQMLITAARYGTDMIVYTNMNEREIRQEIKNYLSHKWIKGRKLGPEKLPDKNIKIRIDKYHLPEYNSSNVSAFFSDIKHAVHNLINPLDHTSYVEIYYEFKIPKLFSPLNMENIYVSGRSEVLAGTGCKK